MDQKTTRLSITPDDDDRISKLPDEILSHILSYLPTKYSVRTRILSTRWKYVFTLVPVLDFLGPLRNFHTRDTIGPFLEFVDLVMNSYNVDRMERFIYSLFSLLLEPEGARLVSWIQNIVNRGVQVLCVTERLKNTQTLPQNVLTSETFTVLKLHGNFNLDVPDNVWLPCLKTLDLSQVMCLGENSEHRLFRSCPVLENLFLYNCGMQNSVAINICSPSLSRLKIHGFKHEYELVLDVPNVRYFEYYGNELLGISVRCGLKSLVDASISFPRWWFVGFDASSKLVSFVSHVQTLHFCACTLEVFQIFGQPLPTFHYLTRLEMALNGSFDFSIGLLIDLLDTTPHLDFLGLDNAYAHIYAPTNALELEHVLMCVSAHLKVIKLRGLSSLFHDRMLVEYFLKNAKVLNILYIRLGTSLDQITKMKKKNLRSNWR